jgi:hypothetical protein
MMVGLDTRRARCKQCLSMHHPKAMIWAQGHRFCTKGCAAKYRWTFIPVPRSDEAA